MKGNVIKGDIHSTIWASSLLQFQLPLKASIWRKSIANNQLLFSEDHIYILVRIHIYIYIYFKDSNKCNVGVRGHFFALLHVEVQLCAFIDPGSSLESQVCYSLHYGDDEG